MRIALLTNAYPYHPGEQFIEDEIEYWGRDPLAHVTVLPAVARGEARPVPNAVSVDLCMANGTLPARLFAMWLALFSGTLWREWNYLRRAGKWSGYTVARALLHTSKVIAQARSLRRYIRRHGEIDVAYCYWNDTQSYAALLVKQAGGIRKVISRIHGIDLHEVRKPHNYMPLKRQFIHTYDRVFTTSGAARDYLQETYGAAAASIAVSPLGVPLARVLSKPSRAGVLHVVSVSFCLPVKRLDRIVEAMQLFALRHQEIAITWTHIGGGPLLGDISRLAAERLSGIGNISFEFLGAMENDAVKRYYAGTPVDVFINVSESEGVPVSIMEAMSAGVPAVAPDVGGISNLVSNQCGVLLGKSPSSQDIVRAVETVAFGEEKDVLRTNARKMVEENFDSERNYSGFVATVMAIGAH
ncbi:glycosyltransferase [Dyella mobilis]|uniref:Glycosyltransferase n=1 Tax=Dyella mobilis TaxID=1849582 RepID=A0ABS2KIM4_9GAMM|nr:glycosyltransferase [Dyella mobilis]MBM7131017.1 glycosyltransferase [Dyella mobilis]GLQ97644.1 glycosyl transferase family 1 [Dyella mobilis]